MLRLVLHCKKLCCLLFFIMEALRGLQPHMLARCPQVWWRIDSALVHVLATGGALVYLIDDEKHICICRQGRLQQGRHTGEHVFFTSEYGRASVL